MPTAHDSPSAVRPALEPVAVGVDSLYLGHFSDGLGIDWEMLRYEKEKLRATPGASHTEIGLGGERFALHRSGLNRYPFRLSNKAFTLGLSERMQPRCYAQFSSQLLWIYGLDSALERFNAIWISLGSRSTRPEVVSRVDAAFDFQIAKPDFRTEHFVSQAAKDSTWRENQAAQSYQFGKGDVVCRVYDKVAEIEQQSGKAWLFDIWGVREGVWRVEFQVRGDRLKQAGIASAQQMKAYLPGLVRHLGKHHTSLRIPSADTNRSRWLLHPVSQGVIASADQLTRPPDHPPPPLLTGSEYLLQRQLRSIQGDLKGLAATLSADRPHNPVTLSELVSRLLHLIGPHHSEEIWRADVLQKMRRRELGL